MTAFPFSRQSSGAKLNSAERKLLAAVVSGILVDLQAGRTRRADPSGGARWGGGRTIRASLLARLLTGDLTPQIGRPRAVKLRGARITGSLNLEAATLTCPLLLQDCHIDEPVSFDEVTAPAIRMPGCHLPGLTATQLRTTGDLDLTAAVFTRTGEIRLDGARIGGSLSLSGVTIRNPGGTALNADYLAVEGSMLCVLGFSATGAVSLAGAQIGGQLGLLGSTLTNAGGIAMSAPRLTVGGNMSIDNLTAEGEILLIGATIGGDLTLRGAKLANPGRTALTADRIIIGQGMHMNGLSSVGEVRLPGAHISGQLVLNEAKLDNPGRTALYAAQLMVDSDMACMDLTAAGFISLDSAHIGKQLYFTGARLTDPDAILTAADLTVVRDVFCNIGFTATCMVSLRGASIGGELNFNGASLASESGLALDIGAASIQTLRMPQECPHGTVDFTNAKVGVFIDGDDQESWPTVLCLRGFTYDSLQNRQAGVQERLNWLTRHIDGYVPEIYDQLSDCYRRAGQPEKARKVAIAKQWRRRSPFSPFNWLLRWSVGYGYRNWLAAIWLAAILAAGTAVFNHMRMTATTSHPPKFNAFGYTVDTTVPIVSLGQKGAWQPQGSGVYLSWTLTGVGWILTTAAVAGLTGVLKRD